MHHLPFTFSKLPNLSFSLKPFTINPLKCYKVIKPKQVTQGGRGLTSGSERNRNPSISPTGGAEIEGWPTHLRLPNLHAKPCNVRGPNMTFGSRIYSTFGGRTLPSAAEPAFCLLGLFSSKLIPFLFKTIKHGKTW